MAFTDKELELIRLVKERGGTADTARQAIENYRTGKKVEQPRLQETIGDIKETGQALAQTMQDAETRRQDIKGALQSGEQGLLRSGLQAIGAGASTASRAIGDVFTGALKIAAPQRTEESVASGVQKIAQPIMESTPIQALMQRYQGLSDVQKRDVDALLGVGSLALDVGGFGVGKKTAGALSEQVKNISLPKMNVRVPDLKLAGISSELVNDIVPKAAQVRDNLVARSFGLSPKVDVANIKMSTGNDIGEFMARYDLIKNTPDESLTALNKFHIDNYNIVRDAVSLVDDKFTFSDLPALNDTIDLLMKDFAGRKSDEFVDAYNRLSAIKESGSFDLLQAQEIKSLFDRVESIYKQTGEVREALTAQDKANLIRPVRRFIEDRTKEATGIDVRPLNNNTQTARAIADAIRMRAGKTQTSSPLSLTDLNTLGFGTMLNPAAGISALFVKKTLTSAPVQLRIARWLAGDAKALDGLTPAQIKDIDKTIQDEMFKRLQESDSQAIPAMNNTKAKTSISPSKAPTEDFSKGAIPTTNLAKELGVSEDLVKEARKYKTAEEFVKAQGTPIYHATDSALFELKDFDPTKAVKAEQYFNPLGAGMYASSNADFVKRFGKNRLEFILPTNSKIKNVSIDTWEKDFPSIVTRSLKNMGIKYNDLTLSEKVDINRLVPNLPIESANSLETLISDVADRLNKKGSVQKAIQDSVMKQYEKYDIVRYTDTDYPFDADEILIKKPSQIKTKSQLTDIWNKANK